VGAEYKLETLHFCIIYRNNEKVMTDSSASNSETLFTSKLFKVVKTFITGRSGKRLERHIIVHPGAVAVLPILNDGRIVLIRQQRVAAGGEIIEIPAGTLEPNEPPISTARRELIEETGYVASTLTPVFDFFCSPGFVQEKMHLFLATNLIAGPTALEDGENINTFIVTPDEAMQMISRGEINDAKTLVALLWHKNKTAT
jgi:ADP-ribose pyrophosphatase